ncbi:MAG: DUF6159 family protein [Solirubrobacterales bacterium]
MASQRTPAERARESRLTRGSRLAKGAWRLTRRDRALISLALVGGAVLALAALVELRVRWNHGSSSTPLNTPFALLLSYCVAFVAMYFATAIAAAAEAGYDGNPMSTGEALAEAFDRKRQIAHWALISLVVGVAVGALAAALTGIATWVGLFSIPWALATAFVVPIIAVDGDSAERALRRSVRLAAKRWREEIGGYLTFGFFGMLAAFTGGLIVGLAFGASDGSNRSLPALTMLVVVPVVAAILLLLFAAAQSFAVGLYRHATAGGSFDTLEDPPAPRRPSGGWLVGRGALALVGGVVVLVLATVILPTPDHRQVEAERGNFQMSYPVSYGVELEAGAPVVYGERQVGVVRGCEIDGANVIVDFYAEPVLWPLIVDHRVNFDRYRGHYYLRIGPRPGAAPVGSV